MLANFAFGMNYSLVGYLYFIPTYLLWGIFMSIAAGGLAYLTRRWTMDDGRTTLQPSAVSYQLSASRFTPSAIVHRPSSIVILAGAALALALVFAVASRYPSLDQSGQTQTRDQTLALLSAAPQGATLYLDWEALSAVRYYRYVYGMRRDLTLHSGDP